MLETARDALFLASVDASRLPLLYIAIAALSLLVNRVFEGRGVDGSGAVLAGGLAAASVGTAGFWWWVTVGVGPTVLYALYIWSGVLVTVLLLVFWSLLAARFTVNRAKRVFATIGAGSVAGAIVGSALSGVIATLIGGPPLIGVAALLLLVSAIPASMLRGGRATGADEADDASGRPSHRRTVVAELARRPYARRVALVVLVATMTVTVADYVFKSAVASSIEPDRLAMFFAWVYLAVNVCSLAVQTLVVSPVLRSLRVYGALAILPALLVLAGSGVVLGIGVAAAIAVELVDGSLRHSLHRTASELLYVPMPDRVRSRIKAWIGIVAQRGGQALASIGILGMTAVGLSTEQLGVVLVVLAAAWVGLALSLRSLWLGVFRGRVQPGLAWTSADVPELDLPGLEVLIERLNSNHDPEVTAAIVLLDEEGRSHLVPALLLYHPSDEVVEEALRVFVRTERIDVVPIIDRVIEERSPGLRAALLAARHTLRPDRERLEARTEAPCASTRSTALVLSLAHGWGDEAHVRDALRTLYTEYPVPVGLAVARTVGAQRVRPLFDIVLMLLGAETPEVREAAAQALGRIATPADIDRLLPWLTDRILRDTIRESIASTGSAGLERVLEVFDEDDLDPTIRWYLPRVIGSWGPDLAAAALLERLVDEKDGMVRYKILRELERMRLVDRELPLDVSILDAALDATLRRALRLIARRRVLERGALEDPRRATDTHDLLVRMHRDKESHAVDRGLRLLALRLPGTDIARVRMGLRSTDPVTRAASLELLEHDLPPRLRTPVMALADDLEDDARLREAGDWTPRVSSRYEDVLVALVGSSSAVTKALAAWHIDELGVDIDGAAPTAEVTAAPAPIEDVRRAVRDLVDRIRSGGDLLVPVR